MRAPTRPDITTMSIFPLPQFEADLAEADRETYERLKPPTSIVVRFGIMGLVGEFPYDGEAKPGCGSKLVVRTPRGVELGEMLTSTCPNSGCSKSVSRQQMLEYIENSGGRDYPFFTEGRVLRIATVEDLNAQARLDASRPGLVKAARAVVGQLALDMKMIDAEPILGGERLTFYFSSEQRVDFRELVRLLASEHHARIELRQIGARDEARLTADYERCGQHCCCRQFLKVLKPVSMRSAKVQKATLDPLKISGRCGRLMCCLRYEDETYESLRKKLPRKGLRVGTPEGNGVVIDTQILTQLALVALEDSPKNVAVPIEELTEPGVAPPKPDPLRGAAPGAVAQRADDRRRSPERGSKQAQQDRHREKSQSESRERPPRADGRPPRAPQAQGEGAEPGAPAPRQPRQPPSPPPSANAPNPDGTNADTGEGGDGASRKRRRRRRRRGRGPDGREGGGDRPGAPGAPGPSGS
ncbi:MAG: hypothetical protein IBJ10_08310 [Phycisphaerales bacterium]|nr:hypothetical protein [Phycisphaerales bacterium]